MADSKYWTLVRRLHAETQKGKIAWEKTSEDGAYQAAFPGFTIVLTSDERSEYMRILNANGELMEVISDEDIPEGKEKQVFTVMGETYKTARRQAMGVEKALDAILGALPAADDEIPF